MAALRFLHLQLYMCSLSTQCVSLLPSLLSHEQVTRGQQQQPVLDQQQHQTQPHQTQQDQRQPIGAGAEALQGLVLLTTGPADDALLGITQQRVMQACQELGLPVLLQPARLENVHAWREAFLTNWYVVAQP